MLVILRHAFLTGRRIYELLDAIVTTGSAWILRLAQDDKTAERRRIVLLARVRQLFQSMSGWGYSQCGVAVLESLFEGLQIQLAETWRHRVGHGFAHGVRR